MRPKKVIIDAVVVWIDTARPVDAEIVESGGDLDNYFYICRVHSQRSPKNAPFRFPQCESTFHNTTQQADKIIEISLCRCETVASERRHNVAT